MPAVRKKLVVISFPVCTSTTPTDTITGKNRISDNNHQISTKSFRSIVRLALFAAQIWSVRWGLTAVFLLPSWIPPFQIEARHVRATKLFDASSNFICDFSRKLRLSGAIPIRLKFDQALRHKPSPALRHQFVASGTISQRACAPRLFSFALLA